MKGRETIKLLITSLLIWVTGILSAQEITLDTLYYTESSGTYQLFHKTSYSDGSETIEESAEMDSTTFAGYLIAEGMRLISQDIEAIKLASMSAISTDELSDDLETVVSSATGASYWTIRDALIDYTDQFKGIYKLTARDTVRYIKTYWDRSYKEITSATDTTAVSGGYTGNFDVFTSQRIELTGFDVRIVVVIVDPVDLIYWDKSYRFRIEQESTY